jgi:hypothetical protein
VRIVTHSKRLEAGQEARFECIVEGSRPRPIITWQLLDIPPSSLSTLVRTSPLDESAGVTPSDELFTGSALEGASPILLADNDTFLSAARSAIGRSLDEHETLFASDIRFRPDWTHNLRLLVCRAENPRLSHRVASPTSTILIDHLQLDVLCTYKLFCLN